MIRVYNAASSFNVSELTFRDNGPRQRFDHQRAPKSGPDVDPERGIWYGAYLDLPCAVVEVFGDRGIIEPATYRVARPQLGRGVKLLDLRGSGARRAGTVPELSKTQDYHTTWEWSRHFYEAAEYDRIDGLLYLGAQNDGQCVALYERAEDRLFCDDCSVSLADPDLRDELLRIADENLLDLAP